MSSIEDDDALRLALASPKIIDMRLLVQDNSPASGRCRKGEADSERRASDEDDWGANIDPV